MTFSTLIEEKEKEFDEKFGDIIEEDISKAPDIKSFLRSSLLHAFEGMKEIVENITEKYSAIDGHKVVRKEDITSSLDEIISKYKK